MLFSNLSQKLDTIEATSARLEITAYLADLWRMLTPAEAGLTCYLLDGYLLPPYKGLEFSLSDKMIVRGLALLADEYGGFEEGVAIDIFGNQDMDFLLNRVRKI